MDWITVMVLIISGMLVIAVAEALRLIVIEIIETIYIHRKRRRRLEIPHHNQRQN